MASAFYTKPHALPRDWVTHLLGCGLIVPRRSFAEKQIMLIGYHRLRIYFLSRRNLHAPGKPFITGTTFNDILKIYKFDAQLRAVCFDACGKFELLFRNSIAEALSNTHGSHPYFELTAYKGQAERRDGLKMLSALYAASKDPRARHYLDTYQTPLLPPIWTMKEFLTFGASERFFSLLSGSIRNQVAREFGLPNVQAFESWIRCLVDLRNICAHHDRLFNRSMQKQPIHLKRAAIPTAPVNKVKAILECLDWMVRHRGMESDVTNRAAHLLNRCPMVQPSELGF